MASSSTDAQQMASVRKELRDLKDNVEKHRNEYASTGSNALSGVIDQANKLWQIGAKNDARAGALDAGLICTTSAIGAQQAGNLDKATADNFIHKLLARYKFSSGQAIKWAELASDVEEAGIYKHVPAATFLLGKFEPPAAKERKERKRKETAPSEPMQTADNVSVSALQETAEEKAQTARMKVLLTSLVQAAETAEKRGAPRRVNMFHLLLNPDSFSQTVENFFDLAFLIKDGFVRLVCEPDAAWLVDGEPPKTDDFQGGLLRVQNILKLDFPTYRKLCDRWCTSDAPKLLRKRATAEHDKEPAGGKSKKPRTE